MSRTTVWVHASLAAYLIFVVLLPLGSWNNAGDDALLPRLITHHTLAPADLIQASFPLVPLVLVTAAMINRAVLLAIVAVVFDLVWAFMHYLSWWAPYVTGHAKRWQIAYALGPTTKVLPTVGSHIAPDAMHLTIDILLLAAVVTATASVFRHINARGIPDSYSRRSSGAT